MYVSHMLFLICLCLTQVNENELYYDQSMKISPVETYFGTDLEKSGKCAFIENEFIQAKAPFEFIFISSNEDFRNIFSDRSATMKLNDFILSMIKHPLYIIYNLGIYFNEFDISDFNIRISRLYLGKSLTKSKYSPVVIVNAVRKPKI